MTKVAMMNYESRMMEAEAPLGLPDGTRRRRRWPIVVAIIVVALLALGAVRFMTAKPAADTVDTKAQIPPVTVLVPGQTMVAHAISATGSLAARVDMPVGVVGEGGLVRQVYVQPGTWVRAGQLLASIDRSVQAETAASLAAQIKVAQADANIAQSELDRARALVDRGFISKADLDRKGATRDGALARVKVAQAQLAETQARNGRLDIRAPASGLVLTRSIEPGQVVGAGSGVLFRIAKDGEMELRAALGQSDLARVAVGNSAQVTPVGSTQVFAGHIWQVSPVVDPQTRQGIARIAVSYNPAIKPGGFASANIMSGQAPAPLLPQSAIQSDDKGNFVYIVNARNEVVRVPVTVGQVSDAGASIASGLTGNERVVAQAGAFLNPGQKVTPILQNKRN